MNNFNMGFHVFLTCKDERQREILEKWNIKKEKDNERKWAEEENPNNHYKNYITYREPKKKK